MPRPIRRHALAALVLAAVTSIAACSTAVAPPAASPAASVATSPATSAGAVAALPLEVAIAEASSLRDGGAFILDVREPDEWVAGHIPDATLIPLGELAGRVAEVPSDRQVVVVCRSGNRSASGRDILLAAGHPGVTSMAGGMNDWAAAGYPTVTGE